VSQSIRFAVMSLVLLAAIPGIGPAEVAGMPATPRAGPSLGVLGNATVDQLPAPDAEVWFLRFGFAPGGFLPPDRQIGPTLIVVESGMVTLTADRPVTVIYPNDNATPAAEQPIPASELFLKPGDVALVVDGTTIGVRNDGGEPANALALLLFSPQREGESTTSAQPVGVTQQLLGVAAARFPAGPGTLTIERVEVAPSTSESVGEADGAEVGAVEQGTVKIDLASGRMWIARSASRGGVEEVRPGTAAAIAAGDGYGLARAVATWSAEAGRSAVVLRARVVPMVNRE
jgi:hypothetical protein